MCLKIQIASKKALFLQTFLKPVFVNDAENKQT